MVSNSIKINSNIQFIRFQLNSNTINTYKYTNNTQKYTKI